MSIARRTWTRTHDLRVVRAAADSAADGTDAKDAATAAADIRVGGHAAVFNQPTLIGSVRWGFVEWIEPRAFEPVLKDDVRYLFNHDGLPMARTTNGTLNLSEDKTGLVVDGALADIQLARDLATLIERGDITQMSFAFYPGEERVGTIDLASRAKAGLPDGIDESWDGLPYRAVTSMERLFDVSAVTYPAYEGTDATLLGKLVEGEVRSFFSAHPELCRATDYSLVQARLNARLAVLRNSN